VASPSEIAEEIDAPLGNVSYHVRFLARVGMIELAATKPRRGAIEHYYRAVGRLRVTDKAWAQVPKFVKDSLIGSTLDQIARVVGSAASNGGFDRKDGHVSRRSLALDEHGFSELALALKELVDRAHQIEHESAKRLATSDHAKPDIKTGLVLMLFDAADSRDAAVSDRRRKRSRAAQD
jgi:DNA-binding transcriptional ArsR family regulator